MSRNVYSPTIDASELSLPVAKGGTGAMTAATAAANLGLLTTSQLGGANGALMLDGSGKVPSSAVPTSITTGAVSVTGPTSIVMNTANAYTITDYDAYTTYTLVPIGGSVSRTGDTITYNAPNAIGGCGFVVNGKTVSATTINPAPNAPTITSPVQGANGLGYSNSATTSAFSITGTTDTHYSSDWLLSSDSGFTAVVLSATDDQVNKTSWSFSGLTPATTYYMRCRHKGTSTGYGAWSASISFTTKASFLLAEQAKLLASDPSTNDYFGISVSMSSDGSRAIVSAHYKTGTAGDYQGAAYVYLRTGATWAQESKLLASDPSTNDRFGYSVSMSSDGSRAIVGAYYKTGTAGGAQGAAYVYLRTGATWAQESKLLASDPSANDYFGWSVSMSSDGSRAIVSAHYKTGTAGDYQGAAYVYLRTGATWAQESKLLASDPSANDYFGHSVSMSSDGSRAIIGALNKTGTAGAAQGAAYVYLRTGATWAQESKLLASDPSASDYFGISVSMSSDGSRAIVGAFNKTGTAGGGQGAAYVYLRTGATWAQESKLLASDPSTDDQFGVSVSMSSDGSRAIVGAYNKTGTAGSGQGTAYIYLRTGATWAQESKLLASDPSASDNFGVSVSMSSDGSRAIIGAYNKTGTAGSGQGAAYIYSY